MTDITIKYSNPTVSNDVIIVDVNIKNECFVICLTSFICYIVTFRALQEDSSCSFNTVSLFTWSLGDAV